MMRGRRRSCGARWSIDSHGHTTSCKGCPAFNGAPVEGYQSLEAAVDAASFYDRNGAIAKGDYHY
jgi:hypothetical protein